MTDLLLYGNAHTWEDISFLRPLTNLQRLALDNQVLHLQDLSDLSGLTELRELSLNLEGMGSLDGLEHLTHLQELQLSADFAAGAEPDLSPLSGLTALTTLRLYLPYDVSVSLEPLGALTQLRDLEFNGNVRSNNLSPLGDLTSLQSIRVQSDNYQDPFDDLSPFAELEDLGLLEISAVADDIDLSPIATCPMSVFHNFGLPALRQTPLTNRKGEIPMAQIECGRGHLYDPEKYATCPYCKNNQQITVAAAGRTAPIRVTDAGRTAPLSSTPVTAPQRTAPLTPPPQPHRPWRRHPGDSGLQDHAAQGLCSPGHDPGDGSPENHAPQGLRAARARPGTRAHRTAQVPRPQRPGRGQDRGHDAGADGL